MSAAIRPPSRVKPLLAAALWLGIGVVFSAACAGFVVSVITWINRL